MFVYIDYPAFVYLASQVLFSVDKSSLWIFSMFIFVSGRRSFFFSSKFNNPSSLENLRTVEANTRFYCPPAQWAPASAIASKSL